MTINGHVDVPKHNETALMQSVSHTVGSEAHAAACGGCGAHACHCCPPLRATAGRPRSPPSSPQPCLSHRLLSCLSPPALVPHPRSCDPSPLTLLAPSLPPLQPTVAAVCCGDYLDQWHLYKSGVMGDSVQCTKPLDHSVLVAGYDTDAETGEA